MSEFNIGDIVYHIERLNWRGVVAECYECGDCRVRWTSEGGSKPFFLVHRSKSLVLIEHGYVSDFKERIRERIG